jgi:hypothetical protein
MLISHLHRFIYLKTIKTGGTSVEIYFERYCVDPSRKFQENHSCDQQVSEWGIVGCRQRSVEDQIWYNHLPASGVRELIGDQIWNDYYKFCVVRNPFDKVVSSFWYWLPAPQREELQHASLELLRNTFSDWVHSAPLPKDQYIYVIDNAPAVDRFVRYETLQADLAAVCGDLALPWEPASLGQFKSGFRLREEHFSLYYNAKTSKLVRDFYKWELDYFKYPDV